MDESATYHLSQPSVSGPVCLNRDLLSCWGFLWNTSGVGTGASRSFRSGPHFTRNRTQESQGPVEVA